MGKTVESTMNNPLKIGSSMGKDSVRAGGAFNTPGHDVGNGGIPCHTFVDLGAKEATTIAPALASPDKSAPSPSSNRRAPMDDDE